MTSESVTSMQDVYDLIIATCEHDPEFHTRGASALRYLNRVAQAIEALGAATVKQGAVHESAVPEGNAP